MSVFVVHPLKNDVDITPALVYGQLAFVNPRYVYIDELDGMNLPENITKNMEKAVDAFDPEGDYLLIAGDHLQLIAMSALLSHRWGAFKVLRYDREAKGYAPVQIQDSYDPSY